MSWSIIARLVANLVVLVQVIQSVKSENVYLNKKITEGDNTVHAFETTSGLSVERCIDECEQRKKCYFVNFHIYTHVCYMFTADSENTNVAVTDSNGFIYAKKSDRDMTSTDELCTDCIDTQTCQLDKNPRCIITGCGIPPAVDNTIVLGNRYVVGSMLKYKCKIPLMIQTGLNSQITCLENGAWADVETLIQCTYPIPECRENWSMNDNSCYLLVPDSQSWNDSKKHCETLQTHLVDIGSQEEAEFLNTKFNNPAVHIGLNDLVTEGDFRWSDNSSVPDDMMTNWGENENNFNKANEDCVMLRDFAWSDITCERLMRSICEYEL